jgi:type II secretory pathway pseudopilin PulG
LLEVLVATTIMGIAVVGILSTLTISVRNAARITDHDRAAQLARAQMDMLLTDLRLPKGIPFEGALEPALLGGRSGGWRARVTPFDVPPGAGPGTPILERIEVVIWWRDGVADREFRMDAYRRGALAP